MSYLRLYTIKKGDGFMSETSIMSGINQIPYDKVNVMETLKEEAIKTLGQEKWDEITANIEIPTDDMESEHLNHVTRELLKRFDKMVDSKIGRNVFCNVKHGLKRSDFLWAREKFLQYNDIDAFCCAMQRENLAGFTHAAKSGELFHGQPIDESVLQFIKEQPYLLYGARDNNAIKAVAIPCETQKYLRETEPDKKRYFACHCQFARKSILHKEGAVSKTICNCSLGHTKIFWEAVFDTQLDGKVVSSVLGDGLLCCFIIYLPDEIMGKYVHTA
jgi:hypothetical protein